ncbi:PAS domain S-box protein [Polyangium sp. 6x1]|uniref:PAS domain S-box protein n=1 Tax=Polyangium sp. 6x1 TaxID=3042689 RepID=UPI00248303C1|nr:PAS domain S-box protein [Polyangium sp. 6x1]MDI1442931.1 PAS domain S-box protein [Polyangium sp. 6x1]
MKEEAARIAELEAEVRALRARVAELEAAAVGKPEASEERFDEAFVGWNAEGLVRATIGWSLEGAVTRWSEEAARLLGYAREEALGMPITDLMGTHRRTAEELRQWADRMMARPAAAMRTPFTTRDGRPIQLQWSHTVLRGAEGQPTEILSEVEDVTDQQATERALRDSQRLLLAVLDNTPSYVFVKDTQGRFLIVNRQVETYLGKTRAEIAGLTDYDIFPRDLAAFFHRQDDEALRTGRAMQYEQTLPSPDGPLSYLALKFPVLDAQANPMAIAVISTDITERRRAEEEQAMLREQVIEAQRAALRELATPLMPLAEGVVALPLVGAIDEERADEIMHALLDGVSRYGAHTAILDVTGVRNMDAHVASALVAAARAAELLGARVVITGIRGEVAQTLVHLGEGLGGLTTRGTLRAGIAWALRR